MESEFDADLQRLHEELEGSRAELIAVLDGLTVEDLDRTPRGSWSVRRILEHVIESEAYYARSVAAMRRVAPHQQRRAEVESPQSALRQLQETRRVLLAAVEGVDEESFYQLRWIRTEEGHRQNYSILSLLQNAVSHDREHLRQVVASLRAETRS